MLAVGEGGDKMNKIAALLLTILFALSVMGCATTEDRAKWYYEQSDKIRPGGAEQLWYPGP
jgi:hypothetical protein